METQKILLVDDTPSLLKLGTAIFETGGFEVFTAGDGVEALEVLSQNTINLIVTDILMPNMDGYSLCHQIHNHHKYSSIPVIIYSATFDSKSDETLALEVGADMYILKPASMNFLLDAARKLISEPGKYSRKTIQNPELAVVTQQYNSSIIEKLEIRNLQLEQLQDELIKSEKRFRALVENTFDAISLQDENGRIVYQSPATERMLGYTPEERKGQEMTYFFHSDDIPDVLNRVETAMRNPGVPIYGVDRMRHKEGHYIWVEGTTTNLLGDESVKAMLGNFRDISERRATEEKIRKSESNLRAVFENSSESLILTDTAGIILTFNDNARKTTLLTCRDEMAVGRNILEFVEPDRKDNFARMMSGVLAGVSTQYDQSFSDFEGHFHCYDFAINPVRQDGVITGICYNGRDITERLLAQKKIESDEKRYKALVENGGDAVAILSGAGKPLYVSPSIEKVLGYTENEAMQIAMFSIIHPEDIAGTQKVLENVLASPGIPLKGHTGRMLHKDGTWHWYEATVTNMLHDPAIGGIVDNFRDVTERILAEEKIIKANRLYTFVSAINQTIVRVDNEHSLFEDACKIAVEIGKYQLAWIGTFDEPNRKLILAAHCNATAEDLDLIGALAYDESGPTANVLKNGTFYVVNDFDDEPSHTTSSAFATQKGFNSKIVLPLRKSGEIVGTLNLFSSQKNLFDDEEILLLDEVAGDISFAMEVFEKEKSRQVAERKLIHSEQSLNQAQAIAHIGSWDRDLLTNKGFWSDEHCRIYGIPTENNTQSFENWLSFIHPDDLDEVVKAAKESHDLAKSASFYHRIIRPDGSIRFIHSRFEYEFDSEGKPVGRYGVTHDITEQKKQEEKIIHANRLYAFISAINQTIVHAADEQMVFREACRIAVELGKFKVAWIGVIDESNLKIDLVAEGGMLPEDIGRFSNVGFETNTGIYTTLKTGEPFICNDLENGPLSENWKAFAATRQWMSHMVLPIRKSGKIIATFNIISSEKKFFNSQEATLLEEAADDISFALEVFEKDRQRKEMERKITHSEFHLKQAQAIAHLGSWALDFKTGISLWSDEACRIYGLSPDDNIQSLEAFLSFVHPDDLEGVMKITKERQETMNSSAFHHRIIRKDGKVRYIHSQSHVEYNARGLAVGLYGVTHDETEIREAELAMEQSEANLRLIMDLIPQSIFVKNYDGKFVFVNKSFSFLYGLTPEQMMNRYIADSIPVKSEAQHFISEDQAVILSGETKIIPEHNFTDFIGNKRLFHTMKVPFTVAGTGEKVVLGIANDITRQKQDEADRAEIIAAIVQRNKDLEQFSYIVSHNLRAPVANIIGLAEVANLPEIGLEELRGFMGNLAISVKKLDDVVMDLNYILQLKEGATLQKETVSFSGLLDDITLSIGHIIKIEGVNIQADFSEIDEIFTLKSYIYSIFYNLISNSIKYKKPGVPPIIQISTQKTADKIMLTFKDSGLGIDLEKRRDQVFGLYKRFHLSVEGKGMGLFMVKTQVETLGGTISISSEVNKGTEFKIELPINLG